MTVRGRLLREFATDHPTQFADLLGEQPVPEAARLVSLLPENAGAAVLERMSPPVAAGVLSELDSAEANTLLAQLTPERGVALLRRMEPVARERILDRMPGRERMRQLLAYPRETAGGLMDPSVASLPAELDLSAARGRVVELSADLALEVYLLDDAQRLLGVADLREVLDPSRTGPLRSLMRPVEPLDEHAELASVAAHPGWLRHGTLPVVDQQGLYLGAVWAERMRRTAHEAAQERSRSGANTVLALGELFWLGLNGLFSSLAPREERRTR